MEGKYHYFKVTFDSSRLGMGKPLEITRYVSAMDKVHALTGNSMSGLNKNLTKTGTIRLEEISYDHYCDCIIAQTVLAYLEEEDNTLEPLYARYFAED